MTRRRYGGKRTYRDLAADQQLDHVRPQSVSVLVQEAVHVVPDLPGVMPDRELGRIHSGPRVQFAQSVIVVTLLQEREIRGFREVALVVQQVKDAHRFLRDQMNDRQIVLRRTDNLELPPSIKRVTDK